MRSLISSELSLGCSFYSALKTSSIGELMTEVKTINSESERIAKLDDYVDRLEAEIKKIEAFKRELPLCMLLLSDAIVMVKEELTQCKKSNAMPVLEQFMPLKKGINENDEIIKSSKEEEVNSGDKRNWMSSVQLWNSDNQQHNNRQALGLDNLRGLEEEINRPAMSELFWNGRKRTGGTAFLPFKVEKKDKGELTVVPGIVFRTPEFKNPMEEIDSSDFSTKSIGSGTGSNSATNDHSKLRAERQASRKQRRCWSPELHRRFVGALEQLGGAQAATPKQIRELMQVDGLSNDEVKSHLQKYRIHTRRIATTMNTSPNQPLVLEGEWVPQEHSGESSKHRDSQSGSPQGPTHFVGCSRGTSLTGGDSSEDEEDKKSESHSWKYQIQLSMRDDA